MGGQLRDVAAIEDDLAASRTRLPADRHHQRGLARAVGADQRDDLTLIDIEIHAFESANIAVIGFDAAN